MNDVWKSLGALAAGTLLAGCQPQVIHNAADATASGTTASQEGNQAPVAAANAAEQGKAFLAANKGKDGVKTTASGLQYVVNKPGDGKQPKATDTVTVTYEGRLIDGTVFDSTAKHGGEPISFGLGQVIPGWTEGVQLMKEGAEYTFFIPSELAYGEQGAGGGEIPPNSVLVFDVKLLQVKSNNNK